MFAQRPARPMSCLIFEKKCNQKLQIVRTLNDVYHELLAEVVSGAPGALLAPQLTMLLPLRFRLVFRACSLVSKRQKALKLLFEPKRFRGLGDSPEGVC